MCINAWVRSSAVRFGRPAWQAAITSLPMEVPVKLSRDSAVPPRLPTSSQSETLLTYAGGCGRMGKAQDGARHRTGRDTRRAEEPALRISGGVFETNGGPTADLLAEGNRELGELSAAAGDGA